MSAEKDPDSTPFMRSPIFQMEFTWRQARRKMCCRDPRPPRQPEDQNCLLAARCPTTAEAARRPQQFSGCRALKTSCFFRVLLLVLQKSNLAGARLEAQGRPRTFNHGAQNLPQEKHNCFENKKHSSDHKLPITEHKAAHKLPNCPGSVQASKKSFVSA